MIVTADGAVVAVPPFANVLIAMLLSATSAAASVDSGPGPEMVTVPARPAVWSEPLLALATNTYP